MLTEQINKIISKERLLELDAINEQDYGLGLKKVWELSRDHPFTSISKQHDFDYLLAKELEDAGRVDLARELIKESDNLFCKGCFCIAEEKKSSWLRFQAKAFCYIVVSYRRLRFGKKGKLFNKGER